MPSSGPTACSAGHVACADALRPGSPVRPEEAPERGQSTTIFLRWLPFRRHFSIRLTAPNVPRDT